MQEPVLTLGDQDGLPFYQHVMHGRVTEVILSNE